MSDTVENYVEDAVNHFRNGCNCAQAVAAVFCGNAGLSQQEAKTLTAGFEGGKKEFCGAFLGATMIAEKAGLDIVVFLESINNAFTQNAGSVYCKAIKANKFSCKDCVALSARVLAQAFGEKE